MTVTSPYERAANVLKTVIDTEWATEGLVAEHDNLHESLGYEGARVGIAPTFEEGQPGADIVQNVYLDVKFFDAWIKEVNQEESVDPRVIARHAERFRRACLAAHPTLVAPDHHLWFFNVESIEYPDDPTGNKSRFLAHVCAYSDNAALVETTG